MKKKKHIISRVLPGSIEVERTGAGTGDVLAEINHQLVEDVLTLSLSHE